MYDGPKSRSMFCSSSGITIRSMITTNAIGASSITIDEKKTADPNKISVTPRYIGLRCERVWHLDDECGRLALRIPGGAARLEQRNRVEADPGSSRDYEQAENLMCEDHARTARHRMQNQPARQQQQ